MLYPAMKKKIVKQFTLPKVVPLPALRFFLTVLQLFFG